MLPTTVSIGQAVRACAKTSLKEIEIESLWFLVAPKKEELANDNARKKTSGTITDFLVKVWPVEVRYGLL